MRRRRVEAEQRAQRPPRPPLHLIHDALLNYGYLAAFGLIFAGAAFLPIPGNLVIVIAGALLTRGYGQIEVMLPVIVLANVAGDTVGYGLARRTVKHESWRRRADRHAALGRLEAYLLKRPLLTVIGSRFVPFANAGVNMLSGMCRLSPARFVAADLIGNTGFAAAYLALGVAFGRVWGDAAAAAAVGGGILLVAGLFALAGVLLVRPQEAST